MKSLILIIAVTFVSVSTGCGFKEVITPVSGKSASDSYQPTTKGSTWKYSVQLVGVDPVEQTITMTGGSTLINGKTYYEATSVSKTLGSSTGYFYSDGSVYSTRASSIAAGVTLDMQYLDLSKSVGAYWTSKVNDSGYVNGIPGQFRGTIAEKGITKTIGGKSFTDVIHTTIDLQYDYGSGFETFMTYEYYLAKGVGLIELDTTAFGFDSTKETILTYDVK